MSDLECDVCGNPASGEVHLKNGEWVYEPLSNLVRGVEPTDLDGMLCASWSGDRLTLVFHSASDVRDACGGDYAE